MAEIIEAATTSYGHKQMVVNECKHILADYKDLRPMHKRHFFCNGQSEKLLCLEGTIPIQYKGKTYNIPLVIWIVEAHPYTAPMVCVQPTATMNIKPGPNVSTNGLVSVPFLRDWRHPGSDLAGLIQILQITFGESPPVFAKKFRSNQSPACQACRPAAYTTSCYPGNPQANQYPSVVNDMKQIAGRISTNTELVIKDCTLVLAECKDLRPKQETFTFFNGESKSLLCLEGCIPIYVLSKRYDIPIEIWLMETHPDTPPMVYIRPTATMCIKTGPNVGRSGLINVPYLMEWRYPNSDLMGLIQVLQVLFSESPPVFARPRNQIDA